MVLIVFIVYKVYIVNVIGCGDKVIKLYDSSFCLLCRLNLKWERVVDLKGSSQLSGYTNGPKVSSLDVHVSIPSPAPSIFTDPYKERTDEWLVLAEKAKNATRDNELIKMLKSVVGIYKDENKVKALGLQSTVMVNVSKIVFLGVQ